MNITFQKIASKDLGTVLKLFKDAAIKIAKKNVDHWQYWKNPPTEKINWVKNGILNGEFFFILNKQQDTIGMVRILDEDQLYWGLQNDKAKYVHSLVIKEEFNGKGIGKIILEEIKNQAKKENCNFLRLDADANNKKLCAFYEKLDFIKVGTKEMPLSINNLYEKKIV